MLQSEYPQYVVQLCQHHERQQEVHAEVLNHQEEVVVETLAGEEFEGGEEGMTAVECRDG